MNRFFLSLTVAAALIFASGCTNNARRETTPQTETLNFQTFQSDIEKVMSGRSGAAVAIDPFSGRILAIVNPQSAVYGAYPVGSAFKPLTVIAALEDGVTPPSRVALCEGKTELHGQPYKCWLAAGHGRLDMLDALARSCNIYFYQLGERMKGPALSQWARKFGFGSKPGFAPAGKSALEATGSVPDLFPPGGTSLLAAGDTPELLASPMQMAVFAASIANGGKLLRPHSDDRPAEIVRAIRADKGIAAAVEGMARCVTDAEGTCRALSNLGFDSAGKTGTPRQAGSARTHAWFIGFSPIDEPRIAVAVFINRGRGETDAAPVASEILNAFYRNEK